ncbi:MAG: hypothetical protein LIV24_04790 [Eubacterium sp.]|nr:hypothetical protein [Eubacterium sp.]
MVKNHPDVVEAMVKSIYEAEDYWKANKDSADKFMAEKMGVSEDSFKSQIGNLIIPDIDESLTFFDTSGDENSWGSVQNTVEKFMKDMDVIDADIDCNTMLNSDFLKEYKASSENDAGADASAVSASS